MKYCSECGKEMSESAEACPSCGHHSENKQSGKRKVGIGLGIGIFLVPIVFSWFTLRKGHTTKSKVIAFVWLAICVLVVAGSGNQETTQSIVASSSGAHHSEVTTKKSEPAEKIIQVRIGKLILDYKNNEVGADNKYKGHLVQTTGIVSAVKKDILDNLYVTIGTGRQFEMRELQAFFSDSMNGKLSSLNKGQKLTVVCRIDGLMMNVIGKHCIIKN